MHHPHQPTPGDAEWWCGFLSRHNGQLAAYAFCFCRSDADAEDLVQDALLGALRQSTLPADPLAYVMRSIRNRVIDARRRLKIGTIIDPDALNIIAPDPAPPDASTLARHVNALTPQQREVVILRLWSGLKLDQIAHVTGLPPGTVSSHYARAVTSLRASFGRSPQECSHGRP